MASHASPRIDTDSADRKPLRQLHASSSSTADLLELLWSAQREEPNALDQLLAILERSFRRYFQGWVFRTAESDDVIADLTQETLLLVTRGFRSCRATSELELRAWCRVVSQHVATDYLRAERERPTSSGLRAELGEIAAEPNDAMQDIGYGILLRVLEEAHAGEPDHVHLLLWHRLAAQDSWEETAQALGISPFAAKRRFQRTQQRLRKKVLDGINRLGELERALALAQMKGLCELGPLRNLRVDP